MSELTDLLGPEPEVLPDQLELFPRDFCKPANGSSKTTESEAGQS